MTCRHQGKNGLVAKCISGKPSQNGIKNQPNIEFFEPTASSVKLVFVPASAFFQSFSPFTFIRAHGSGPRFSLSFRTKEVSVGPDPDPLLVSDTFQFKAPVGLLSSSQSKKPLAKHGMVGVVLEFW